MRTQHYKSLNAKYAARRISRQKRQVARMYNLIYIDPKKSGVQKMSDFLVNTFTFLMPSFIRKYILNSMKSRVEYRFIGEGGYDGNLRRYHNY